MNSVFVSATNIFMSVDHDRLRKEQTAEHAPYIDYIITDAKAPLPDKQTEATMSYYL